MEPYPPPTTQPREPPAPEPTPPVAHEPTPPPTSPANPSPAPKDDQDKTWGLAVHLSALAMFIVSPFGNVLGPLVVWLIRKDQSPYVDANGRRALNFQITMAIIGLFLAMVAFTYALTVSGAAVTLFVNPTAFLGTGLVWGLIALAVVAFDVVFTIKAAIEANQGRIYEYPLAFAFFNVNTPGAGAGKTS